MYCTLNPASASATLGKTWPSSAAPSPEEKLAGARSGKALDTNRTPLDCLRVGKLPLEVPAWVASAVARRVELWDDALVVPPALAARAAVLALAYLLLSCLETAGGSTASTSSGSEPRRVDPHRDGVDAWFTAAVEDVQQTDKLVEPLEQDTVNTQDVLAGRGRTRPQPPRP
jgi:hypothetical protein